MKTLRNVLLALAQVALCAPIVLVAMLALWSLVPVSLVNGDDAPLRNMAVDMLALFPLLTLGLWLCLHRLDSWRLFAGLAVLAAPVLTYLAWDDAQLEIEPNIEKLIPLPLRGTESDAVLRWYWSSEHQRATRFYRPSVLQWEVRPAQDEWRLYLVAHRDAIRATWEQSTGVHEWILALDKFPVIGDTASECDDYTPRADIVDIAYLHYAYAGLLSIDGRADEALAVLEPMLSVSRKLQPSARASSRFFLAENCRRSGQHAARFILKTSAPSAPALRGLAAALGDGRDVAAGSRVVIWQEYLTTAAKTDYWGQAILPHRIVGPFVYNPRATANLIGRQSARLAEAAVDGRGAGLRADQAALEKELLTPAFKNPLGRYLAAAMWGRLGKLLKDLWSVDDDRRALLAEVQKRLAAAEGAPIPTKGTP
jgi:hypothetical protein